MTKLEKLTLVGAPWFFGIVMTICGIIVQTSAPERLHGLLLICSGLICMSMYCICNLLVKIIESKKD